jgi:hypothetical protein
VTQYGQAATYLVSGTGKMIKHIKRMLKSQAIPGKLINADWFFGY